MHAYETTTSEKVQLLHSYKALFCLRRDLRCVKLNLKPDIQSIYPYNCSHSHLWSYGYEELKLFSQSTDLLIIVLVL